MATDRNRMHVQPRGNTVPLLSATPMPGDDGNENLARLSCRVTAYGNNRRVNAQSM